jgi:hypothetical protein
MNRFLGAFLLAGAVAVAVGACDDSSSGGYYASAPAGQCSTYTTCDTCTPVQGCGWCFNSTGALCASDPDQCSSAGEFTWTWNQSGCPDVDASVAPLDAGTTTATEAGTTTAADSGTAATEASAEASAGD